MHDADGQFSPDDEPRVPDALRADLSALYGRSVDVPREVDEVVLAAARRRLSPRTRPLFILRWVVPAAAVAALLAVAVFLPWNAQHAPPPAPIEARQAVAAAEDIDGNGRVDILDAFLLARRLETSLPVEKQWDVSGDGTVDGRDVDMIALAAVRLERGTFR